MTVSELIQALKDYMARHGDHEVVDSYDQPIGMPEEMDGACVLADKA